MLRPCFVVALSAAACSFKGGFDGTHYKCGAGDTCPTGQTCVSGFCESGPGTPDAPGSTADAPPGTPDAAMLVGKCGTLGALVDGFDTDTINTWWDPWSDGGPTTSIASSHLIIDLPGGAQGSNGPWAGVGGLYLYDFAESVAQITVGQVAGTDTLIEVRDVSGKKAQMVEESGTLYAWVSGEGTRNSIAYDAGVHKKWRIREHAGTTYWDWSTDGSTWNELWHEADPFTGNGGENVHHVRIELAAGGQQTATTDALYENVNVGLGAPGMCGASSLTDDFNATSFAPKWDAWADTPGTITDNGSAVVMQTDGTINIWSGFQSNHLYDLRGDTYYADWSAVPQLSGFVTWMQAMLPGSGGNTVLEFNVEGTTLQMVQSVNNTDTDSQTLTYDPVAHRYWRFRSDAAATTVYWDTSPDGIAWTMRASAPARFDLSHVFFVHGCGEYTAVTAQSCHVGSINVP